MTQTSTAPTSAIPHPRARRSTSLHPDSPTYLQGALALSYPLPSGLDSHPESRALTVVQTASEDPPGAVTAERWAARFLQAVLEVMAGDRPLTQLIRWTDEQVYSDIARRQLRVAAGRRPSAPIRTGRHQVATVHVCQLSPEQVEVAARITNGRRSRALAARLELHRGRWVCTALQFE